MPHADLLRQRVGAFFTNTYGVDTEGICGVCRGPSPPGRGNCPQCIQQRTTLHGLTCDHTVIFTYAQGNLPDKHQSAHTVGAYKWEPAPVRKCVEDMSLTVRVGTEIHGACILDHIGHQWDSATYVPSSRGRVGPHPVTAIARSVAQVDDQTQGVERFLLAASTSDAARALARAREAHATRFSVPDEYRRAVEGQHVLLVDDTWTSGASVQSAAATLKLAGATSVTGLCVARWLSAHYPDQASLMETLTHQYDPAVCPVYGRVCAPGEHARQRDDG